MMYCGHVERVVLVVVLVVVGDGGRAHSDEGVSRGEEGVRISGMRIHHFHLGSQTVDFLFFLIYLFNGTSLRMQYENVMVL